MGCWDTWNCCYTNDKCIPWGNWDYCPCCDWNPCEDDDWDINLNTVALILLIIVVVFLLIALFLSWISWVSCSIGSLL